jgi:hypothetical protein
VAQDEFEARGRSWLMIGPFRSVVSVEVQAWAEKEMTREGKRSETKKKKKWFSRSGVIEAQT